MRDEQGRYAPNLTAEERLVFGAALGRVELRRVLTAPFGADGHPKDVTPEQMRWACEVVRTCPEWALSVLRELGFAAAPTPAA